MHEMPLSRWDFQIGISLETDINASGDFILNGNNRNILVTHLKKFKTQECSLVPCFQAHRNKGVDIPSWDKPV